MGKSSIGKNNDFDVIDEDEVVFRSFNDQSS